MILNGCHEGKHTPRLSEVKCPKCGAYVDVFVIMGGRPGQTGTLVSDEKCVCGTILPAGSYEGDYAHEKGTMHGFDIVRKAPTTKKAVTARIAYMQKNFGE